MTARDVGWGLGGLLLGSLITAALLPGGVLGPDLPSPVPPRHDPWITFQIPEGYACVCPSGPVGATGCDPGFTRWTSAVCVKDRAP